MATKMKQVPFKLHEVDLENLNAKLAKEKISRQKYIAQLIKQDLYGKPEEEGLSVAANAKKFELEASMDQMMDIAAEEYMRNQMANNPMDLFRGMDVKDINAMILKRVGKPHEADPEQEKMALSLKECLSRLPSMPDITKELNKANARAKKAEYELELQKASVKVLRMKLRKALSWETLKEFIDKAADYVNKYARECEARDLDVENLRLMSIQSKVVD
jgi:hypothetical protein